MALTRRLMTGLMLVLLAGVAHAAGNRILPDFDWIDLEGKTYNLSELNGSNATVFAFCGVGCPLVNLYSPKLQRLHETYAPQGVRFFWINSNELDTREEIVGEAKRFGLTFPAVHDKGNRIADILGAERTTEVFVIDSDRTLRYQGRIDTQYGYGVHREQATQHYLTDALDAVLAGKPVQVARMEAPGCIIGRELDEKDATSITYTKHVAPIIQRNCVSCHRPGEIAPFTLLDYASVKRRAAMIQEVVEDRRMPPWLADDQHGTFANKRGLSKTEEDLLNRWIDNGAPEGDPKDLPEPVQFTEGWTMGNPDVVFEMPVECRIAAEGTMPYQYFGIKTQFPDDRWIRAIEVRPGNRAVVHHILVFIQYPKDRKSEQPDFKGGTDGFFASMVPGDSPAVYEEGMAKHLPKGASLVFQMHYTPIGTPQTDRSSIGVIFANGPIQKEVHTSGITNTEIRIPPHAPDHLEYAKRTLDRDLYLISLLPHMHLRGKSFTYRVFYPDGNEEILLDIPKWDFGWQNAYRFAEPRFIPKGTRIECEAHYDNSAANPANPNPNATVKFDEQTTDEMLIGYYDYYWADEDLTKASIAK